MTRFDFMKKNLYVDFYNSLANTLIQIDIKTLNFENLGEKILPSLIVDKNYWIMQLYQYSMTFIQYFSQLTLFFIFIANFK